LPCIRLLKFVKTISATAFILPLLPLHTAGTQQDTAALLARADELNIRGEYAAAIEMLRPALSSAPDDYGLLCSISDNITGHARRLPDGRKAEKEAKAAVYEEALSFARHAAQINPGHAEGWFQVGQALGRLALFRGGKTKVEMSKEVKEVFEKALALDPKHAGALHGLARWHREVANLSWALKIVAKIVFGGLPPATNEDSVRLFKEAIVVEPDNVNHHLELGKTYMEVKEREQARREFETVGRLPAVAFEDAEYKEEAEQLLRRLRR